MCVGCAHCTTLNGVNGEATNTDDVKGGDINASNKRRQKESKKVRFAKHPTGRSKPAGDADRHLCRDFYRHGKCDYGVGCRFSHVFDKHKCHPRCVCKLDEEPEPPQEPMVASAPVEPTASNLEEAEAGAGELAREERADALVVVEEHVVPREERTTPTDIDLGVIVNILVRLFVSVVSRLVSGFCPWYSSTAMCCIEDGYTVDCDAGLYNCVSGTARWFYDVGKIIWFFGVLLWHVVRWCRNDPPIPVPDVEKGQRLARLYYTSGKMWYVQFLLIALVVAWLAIIWGVTVEQRREGYRNLLWKLLHLQVSSPHLETRWRREILVLSLVFGGVAVLYLVAKWSFVVGKVIYMYMCCMTPSHFKGTDFVVDHARISFWWLYVAFNQVEFDGEYYNCYQDVVIDYEMFLILSQKHPGIRINLNTTSTLVQTLHNELGDSLLPEDMNVLQQTVLVYIQDRRRQLSRERQSIGPVGGFPEA